VEPLLFLSHRIPFPPNKGDKVRSYHLLKHLARRYKVHLGTFVDDPADWEHVRSLQAICSEVQARPLDRRIRRIRSLGGLQSREALTLTYFRDRTLQRWVDETVRRERVRKCFVFSSAMAQYLMDRPDLRRVLDLVDVDSEKWRQYATGHRWPLSWIYRREAERLLDFEAAAACAFDASLLTTPAEKAIFAKRMPQTAQRVHVVANGVDADHFAPAAGFESPFPAGEAPIVFTGAMDYWPNADAVCWFASEILPAVLCRQPRTRFYVVGMNPLAPVQALARNPRVVVTGRVPDTRPYLQYAAVVVAPLRIARGVQNKVLEAMAMARPVVATAACGRSLSAIPGREILMADDAAAFAVRVEQALSPDGAAIGRAARSRVLDDYQWNRNLALVDALLDDVPAPERLATIAGPSVTDLRAARG
jgi:sugar transferase (PEP-CTERM/EpsH1 system associated)